MCSVCCLCLQLPARRSALTAVLITRELACYRGALRSINDSTVDPWLRKSDFIYGSSLNAGHGSLYRHFTQSARLHLKGSWDECTSVRLGGTFSANINCAREWHSKSCHEKSSNWRRTVSHSIPYRQFSDSCKNRFEKENVLTIPNLISLSRIVLSPILGYLILQQSYSLALGLFALAGVSDMVDGYIARRFASQSSLLGSVLDPLADKCLVSVLFVTLTMVDLIPLPLTVLILTRDGLLIAGGFYLRYTTLPPPRTWSRYWDIQRSTLQVTPSLLSKVNTGLQLLLVGLSLGAPVVGVVGHPALQALWWATAVTTVSSGVSYLFNLGGIKVLKEREHSSKL